MSKPSVSEVVEFVVEEFGEAETLRMLLGSAADHFPVMSEGGPRMVAMADRARDLIRKAADLHDALAKVAPDAARLIMAG